MYIGSDVTEQSLELVRNGDYQGAISLLSGADGAEQKALLALAYFHQEDYANASTFYQQALELEPNNADWEDMASLADENVAAGAHLTIPPYRTFNKDALLAGPNPGTLPTPGPKPPAPTGFREFEIVLGNGLGVVCTAVMEGVTEAYGGLAGYRDRVWTNWYKRPTTLGVLTLAYMRNRLNKFNLKDTYPTSVLTAFQPPNLQPPQGATHFRTADGSWNNFANPMEGAAGTRFPRNIELSDVKPETGETLMTPNPREISEALLQRGDTMKEVPFLNMFAASWIQFQNDDWVNHGERLLEDFHEIPFAEHDPARVKYGQTSLKVGKTQSDPTRMEGSEPAAATFINEVTHWWDGSQLYGSDQKTQDYLRSHESGKMRMNVDGTLPRDERGMEESGMVRNWWIGLSMLHTLFVREHNAICDRLAQTYPDWDDNRLFNVARLINAAVMAKVHTVEWTPAVLPNPGLDMGLNANWFGILTNLFKKGKNRKTVADVNIRNAELGGVVGNPIDKHGCHYGLAEEFVEVYRLHSFLPEVLQLKRLNQDQVEERPFVSTRQLGAAKLSQEMSMTDLFYSFGNQHPGQLVLNNYPHFMRQLSIPGNPVFDMGAVDILRARERGVPRYNEFRRQLGLNPIATFEDLTDDPAMVAKLKALYDNDVEKLDLLVGTLGEGTRPTGFGFGETMFQIFILNATRRLQADRFYTDDYDAEHYTQEGLDWIDDSDLKTVILRHYPELADSGLANIKNAFEPWDKERDLKKERHPLREWNGEVKDNPWVGDLYR